MISVYTTAPIDRAEEIARSLVEERFAACVNLHEIESVYRWEGEIVTEDEVALDVKTSRSYTEVKERIQELHPYDVPPIIRYDTEANNEYEDWVRSTSQ